MRREPDRDSAFPAPAIASQAVASGQSGVGGQFVRQASQPIVGIGTWEESRDGLARPAASRTRVAQTCRSDTTASFAALFLHTHTLVKSDNAPLYPAVAEHGERLAGGRDHDDARNLRSQPPHRIRAIQSALFLASPADAIFSRLP